MTEHSPTIELIEAASRGEPRARSELVASWGPTVLSWCARLGGPGVDAEDAAHDIFLHVLEDLHQLRAPAAFPAWIYRISRREIGRHRRRAWLNRSLFGWSGTGDDGPELASPDRGPREIVERAEAVRLVQGVMQSLSSQHREILVLCDLEGRSGSEAASLLGIPEGTVRSRLRLARAAFERKLRPRLGGRTLDPRVHTASGRVAP
jgi:RNA polymerase sigma-70 factor (ECF subfamily)